MQVLNGDIHVYLRRGQKRDLLTEVYDRGAAISVEYAPLSSKKVYGTTVPTGVIASAGTPTPFAPGSAYVVNRGSLVVSAYSMPQAGSVNSADPVNRYTYSYKDGRYDIHGRGWLGFGTVVMNNEQTHARTTTTYDNASMTGTAYPFAHRPHVQDTFVTLSDSGRFNERIQTITYSASGAQDGSYSLVLPKDVLLQEFEGFFEDSNDLIRSIDTKIDYDNFGNPRSVTRTTGDGYVVLYSASYQPTPAQWLISTQTGSLETSRTPTGASTTRTRTLIPDQNTGAMSSQIIEPTGGEETYRQTTYQLDSHGVPTKITVQDKSGRQKRLFTIGFDAEDLYPAYTIDALGHTELFAVHPGFGVLSLHEDINHIREVRQHDSFGRLTSVTPASGASFSVSYSPFEWGLPYIGITYAGGHTSSFYFDAYSNEVERDSTAFDGQTVITYTSYNGQGIVAERDGPCLYGTAYCAWSGLEQYSYDELGRLIGVHHADGSSRKTSHFKLTTTQYDELQNQNYVVQNQLGNVVKAAAVTSPGVEVATLFSYEPFGLLNAISDANGSVMRTVHDIRGRPVSVHDPDSGDQVVKWSTFDELSEERDGNGLRTRYKRDMLGRTERITNKDGTTEFCWDTALHGIGKLGKSKSPDGVTSSYEYDSAGRLETETLSVNRKRYSIGTTYDPAGRVSAVTYPSVPGRNAFQIRRVYNQFGFLKQVLDANTGRSFWETNTQNERGEITQETFGNGIVTKYVFDTRGFLRSITSTNPGNSYQQQLTYSYYPTGSLQSRSNILASTTISEIFQYDPLDRLHEWTVSSLVNGAPPTTAIELLDQIFDYDDVGNLRHRRTTFGSMPTVDYNYGQNGAGPHALTQANSEQYRYDAGGNQVAGLNGQRTVHYTSFNLPANLTEHSSKYSFKYDSDQERVLEKHKSDSTTYFGGIYEQRKHGNQTTNMFYVPGTGRVAAQEQWQGPPTQDKVFFLHDDDLNSVQIVSDGTTGATTGPVGYEPSGQTVDPANPASTIQPGLGSVDRGFTDQIEDGKLALLNMRGRIYDPKIAHFLTPDADVQDRLRSESLNPYGYAWNNPLKWIDPSGFQNEDPSPSTYQSETDPIPVLPSPPTPVQPDPASAPAPNGVNWVPSASDNGAFHLLPDSAQLTCDLCAVTMMPDAWIRGIPMTPDLYGPIILPLTLSETSERNVPQLSAWKVPDALEGVPNKQVLTSSIQDPLVLSLAPQLTPVLLGIRAGQSINVANSLRQQGQSGNAAVFYGMAALSFVPDLHGNSLEALGPHDLYAIRDLETGQIYHFGETGRDIHVRGFEWQEKLFERYGLETEIESLGTFEGKSLAKAMETRYIRTYEKVFGHKPGFFDEHGNFVQTQLTYH